jgi:thymidine kinase
VLDTRCKHNEIHTHNNQTYQALKVKLLMNIDDDLLKGANVIGIDEAQFFDDLPDFLLKIEQFQKIVIIAGLDGDFKRQTFGKILNCIPFADNVTKLTAMCSICKDGTPAIFSKKIENNDNIVDIGANDKYVAVCRKHYL